jgi:dTDP-4-dehydrorhamnose reductase
MAKLKKVFITGATGLLGGMCLWQWRQAGFKLFALVRDREALPAGAWPSVDVVVGDLARPQSLIEAVESTGPDLVVNCAALTKVDQCQKQPELAKTINIVGSEALALAALKNQAGFIHISTDAVYANGYGPHQESEAGGDLSVYASSKLKAESAVTQAHPDALILRTCMLGWNQNPGLTSLAEWMIQILRTGKRLPGFIDACFSPLFTGTLAQRILEAAQTGLKGIFNVGSSDGLSKYQTAILFAERLGLSSSLVEPVSQTEANLIVPRPRDPVMDSNRFYNALEAEAPTVATEVENMLAMETSSELQRFRRFGGYA